VADSSDMNAPAVPAADLARRQFLLRAAVAGTAVWVVPSIIAIQPAAAAGLNSRPPKSVSKPPKPIARHVDPVAQQPQGVADAQLPFTGDDSDDLLVTGIAATAAGASLLFLSKAGDGLGLEAGLAEDV
jgi:hypothetical protein